MRFEAELDYVASFQLVIARAQRTPNEEFLDMPSSALAPPVTKTSTHARLLDIDANSVELQYGPDRVGTALVSTSDDCMFCASGVLGVPQMPVPSTPNSQIAGKYQSLKPLIVVLQRPAA
jgi:hypothetical protein